MSFKMIRRFNALFYSQFKRNVYTFKYAKVATAEDPQHHKPS